MPKIIHTMIRVLDLQKSKSFYQDIFDLKETYCLDYPEFKLLYLRNKHSDFEIELTFNKNRTVPYELGDGYGHIAFVVNDLDAIHKKINALGVNAGVINNFKDKEVLIARFFFISDPDGYKIEILQRNGHYQ
ncbi:VOC family protein [Shewanella sp. D64]|uniref:VOC family protein n=1 Tax=unclassified Shewanella TaxID=196818 RepID=UPI0022BA1281|nr:MULTISPECIES: VOC family protein [unclassified Shewanella]MEC4724692.1 VOC family protein [Shewanella sp. D64]MEC4736514.1 VOC family protein [Shewanella sp. E94]WBJ97433.1 VOC family protein [Shewanella sp. MTB7]